MNGPAPQGPVSPFDAGDDSMATYTIDIGGGRTVDIQGPKNATPDQLQAAVAPLAAQQGAPDQGQVQFGDEGGPQVASRMSPADEATIQAMLQHGASADQVRQFAASKGFQFSNADQVVAARDKTGQLNPDAVYQLPQTKTDALGAAGRGVADTLMFAALPKLDAAVQGAKAALSGGSFGNTYDSQLDADNSVIGADENQHPWARVAGQLLGGFALPGGLEGVGLKAGTDVLRAGGTMDEARAAAKVAVRNRMAAVGTGYGFAHGALSGDNISDAVTGGVTQGVVGGVTGGLLGNLGSSGKPVPAANDMTALANRLGIVPTPATTGGMMAHAAQMALGNVPGGMSAIAQGVDRENSGLADAASGVAQSIGTPTSRANAGEALVQGRNDYAAQSKQAAQELYRQRDALVGGPSAPATVDDTAKALSAISAKYPNSDTLKQLMLHPAVQKIARVVNDAQSPDGPQDMTFGELTDALSYTRSVLRKLNQNSTDPDAITAQVGKVESALESDVNRAAAAADQAAGRNPNATGSAVNMQQQADAAWAERKQALSGTLKLGSQSAKNPNVISATTVYNQLSNDTQKQGGNLSRLRDTWFRLPDDAKNTFASTYLDDLGRSTPGQQDASGDAWSFNTFLTNFNKMSPQSRNIMFGGRVNEQVQDIASYAARLRQLNNSRNFSNTAKNLITGGLLTTIGGALMHGDVGMAGEAAMAVPAAYGSAKLFLATPAMRQWTRTALRVAATQSAAPGSGDALINRLTAISRAEPAIAEQVIGLRDRLSAAFSGAQVPVAAQEPDNESSGVNR